MVNLKPSKAMDTSPLGQAEQFLLRLPKSERERLNLAVGDSVAVGAEQNKKILKVGWAYEHDLECNPNYAGAFITTSLYRELFGTKPTPIEIVKDITFGCDPEAFLVDKDEGSLVDAGLHFGTRIIGHDQGLLEFRPDPTKDCKALLSNMFGAIMASVMYTPPSLEVIATSMYMIQPAGFHVHFGMPISDDQIKAKFMIALGHLLDFYLAIPSIYFEKGADHERRTATVYGSPCDIRQSEHSYEYRTIGAHMFADPRLALLVLATAEIVVKDLFVVYQDFPQVIEGINGLYKAYPTLPSAEIIKEVLKSKNAVNFSKRYILDIMRLLSQYSSYDMVSYFEAIKDLKYNYSLVNNWMWHSKEALNMLGD